MAQYRALTDEELLVHFPRVFKNEFATRELIDNKKIHWYKKAWHGFISSTPEETGTVSSVVTRKHDGTIEFALFAIKLGAMWNWGPVPMRYADEYQYSFTTERVYG